MQLASVLLGRAFALFQIEDLNPEGTIYYPDLAAGLVKRYGFQKYPTKPEDFDESKGIEFHTGRLGETVINKVAIFTGGIHVDTNASTDASEMILQDALTWAAKEFAIAFRPEMLKRWAYVSQITFHSEVPILSLHAVLTKISKKLSKEVNDHFGQPLEYQPVSLSLLFDTLTTQSGTAPFTIQRREGVPFSDNKYFSTAPVKTKVHFALIEQIEKEL